MDLNKCTTSCYHVLNCLCLFYVDKYLHHLKATRKLCFTLSKRHDGKHTSFPTNNVTLYSLIDINHAEALFKKDLQHNLRDIAGVEDTFLNKKLFQGPNYCKYKGQTSNLNCNFLCQARSSLLLVRKQSNYHNLSKPTGKSNKDIDQVDSVSNKRKWAQRGLMKAIPIR